jgi:hypothetical protein
LATSLENADAFPPVFVDLTSLPSDMPLQTFANGTQGNFIEIAPSDLTIDLDRDYIFAPTNLNTLGWQVGDAILYDANGGEDIGGLMSGQTYYLIVYVPGFSKDGVIMNNTVDNCTVSGYQDDKPTTSSAWVNNFGFNSGTPASADANYDIAWAGSAPVYAGDLADYPTGSAKAYNVSLIQ